MKIMENAIQINKMIKKSIRYALAIYWRFRYFLINHPLHSEISFKDFIKYALKNYDYKYYYRK